MIDKTEFSLGRLFFHVCRLRATHADQLMDQVGLYRGQARALLILSHDDGIMHSHIAEKLGISPAATSKVIKRLEEQVASGTVKKPTAQPGNGP